MPEPATKITKAAVDRLTPGDLVWDAEIRGFGVRCQRRGLPHEGDPGVMLIQGWSGRQPGSRYQTLWCGRPVAQG